MPRPACAQTRQGSPATIRSSNAACTQVGIRKLTHFSCRKCWRWRCYCTWACSVGWGAKRLGSTGLGRVLGPSRLQRRASSLLQGPVSLLTSSIYACLVPSHVAAPSPAFSARNFRISTWVHAFEDLIVAGEPCAWRVCARGVHTSSIHASRAPRGGRRRGGVGVHDDLRVHRDWLAARRRAWRRRRSAAAAARRRWCFDGTYSRCVACLASTSSVTRVCTLAALRYM
eukprot:COSAG02_NODE_1478_length_12404_cov_353.335067_4_plen_228_part_00